MSLTNYLRAPSAASGYVCLGDDGAEPPVVGVVVAPNDVPAILLGVAAWPVPSGMKYRNAANCASVQFDQDELADVVSLSDIVSRIPGANPAALAGCLNGG